MKKKTNFSEEELLKRRLAGVLPRIDIMGYPFIIDWRMNELRPVDDFSTQIKFNEMATGDDGMSYRFVYDPDTHSLVKPANDGSNLSDKLHVVEIPYELVLDPVAVAREYGMEDTALLKRFPIQGQLTAKVIPWRGTDFAEIVKKNSDHQESREKPGPKTINKKRRGKRL